MGENVVYNFINSMVEESKCCSDVMKKLFNKELATVKKDVVVFGKSTKCSICDNVYVEGDVKVRGHCQVTGKYRVSAHRDCNITVKLNQ